MFPKFQHLYETVLKENEFIPSMNAASQVFGDVPDASPFSGDTYAPGDARNIFDNPKNKKKKKKKRFPLSRRALNNGNY